MNAPVSRRVCALLVALLGATALRLPHARADEPPSAALAEARARFQSGSAKMEHEAYLDAIADYEQGYALVPLPDFLFNIAQCYRLAGRPADAVRYYERYILADPSGRGVPTARRRLAELRASSPTEVETHPAPATPAPIATPEPRPSTAPPASLSPPSQVLAPPVRPDTSRSQATNHRLRVAGISCVGAGVLAGGIGILYGLHARQLESDAEHAKNWPDYDDISRRGERAITTMYVMYGVAGALAVGGGVLYWMGLPTEEKARESPIGVQPLVSAHGAGLVLTGSF